MPHSLVLNLLPQSPIPPQYLTGRHLHALFLTLVSSVDRELGDRLHNSDADKAFTLSPLQTNSPLFKGGRGDLNYVGNINNQSPPELRVGGVSLY